MTQPKRAPNGVLATFEREQFAHGQLQHAVFRKGSGPAVLVITEIPGVSPQVLGFADRVIALGCTAILPDLFGEAGRDPDAGSLLARSLYMLSTFKTVCVRKEFTAFALGRTSPVVSWLRALAAHEHERCGGPGVGVVGMCFSGGFALAMATDPSVLVPVLSQPSLPIPGVLGRRHSIDCDPRDMRVVADRCQREGLRVLGLRFDDDPLVPPERFAFLREQLGDGFISVELPQSAGHPDSPMRKHHSVLTRDLIDEPGEPTREALDQVLTLLGTKLCSAAT